MTPHGVSLGLELMEGMVLVGSYLSKRLPLYTIPCYF